MLTMLVGVAVAQPVTISPPSATIEPGGSVTLTASGAMYYQWSPATGLSTTEGPVTVASPSVTTTYTCSGYAPGDESVVNGDFEQGNVGFTSAYQYNTNLWGEGTYYVDSDASLHHESFSGHGHNGGNFMIVNGATSPGTNVWTEQISVVPNTYYAFSTWACNVSVGDPNQVALLQFSINGTQIGDIFNAPNQLNVWMQFYELWYSGSATSATITILNQNTVAGGNDFGLDDISFCQLVLVGAPQCTVTVNSMSATAYADETQLCEGASTTLHAVPSGGSGNYSYSWTPANTLSNPNVQNPVATPPLGTSTYNCHITDGLGVQDVHVTIVVHPNAETFVYDTLCYGESYVFYGVPYSQSCQISHTDHTQYGCDSIVWLNLTVYPPNDTLLIDPSICVGETYDFHGTLYDQNGQTAYFDTVDIHGCPRVEKLVLSVGEYQMPPMLHQFECYGHATTPAWTWDKTGTTYHEDTYDEIVLDDPNGGCPILHRLDLKFHEEYYREDSIRACDAYLWPITGLTYSESQDVEKTFPIYFGDKICDSTYVLHLEINTYETNEFMVPGPDQPVQCDSFPWMPNGFEYITNDAYDPENHYYSVSGTYQRIYQNHSECDSVVTMQLHLEYTPSPMEITPADITAPHWVVTATEFQVNSYDFSIWETDHPYTCHWDSIRWEFENPNVRWLLEPDTTTSPAGKRCRMYVLNHIEDTVWLDVRVYNPCAPQGKLQRYWFVSSFYDVDEQRQGIPGFSVAPNPNSGMMTLSLENLTGQIEIKVFDVTGNLLDQIGTFGNGDFMILPYEMKGHAIGVFCFMVIGKEGTVTKKVIVTQ